MSAVPVANQAAHVNVKRPVKTAVHQAVLDGRIHQVRLLVSKHGGNVDSKDMFGRTPLMLACLLDNQDDCYRMSKIFLKAGAYVNLRDNMQRTALHYACMKGKTRTVERLMREEAVSVNAPDNDGNTPLIHAALSGSPRLVEAVVGVLTRFGLSTDVRNVMGYTALLLACKYGHYVSALALLRDGRAQPSLRDNEFFLNAGEWVKRSRALHQAFSSRRPRSMETPRFARERTMYRAPSAHVCHHVKAPSHPLGESLDSALRLPAVFSYVSPENPEESALDGKDARGMLLREIEAAARSPTAVRGKGRYGARPTARSEGPRDRFRSVSTPKLLAFTARSHTAMVPDMRTLFNLYCDQQQDRLDRMERGAMSAPAGVIRNNNNSGRLPGIQVHFEIAPNPAVEGSVEA